VGGDHIIDVPALGAGECQVWWATLGPVRDAHIAVLDAVERDRRDAYRRDDDRDRFTIGVVMTRLVLAAHTRTPAADVSLDRTCTRCGLPHGKPTLRIGGIALSISHAGARIGFACGRVPAIGLDVEKIGAATLTAGLIRHVLTPTEAEALASSPRPDRDFTTYWTRKEAVLKATGDGLRVPMRDIRVAAAGRMPVLESFAGRPSLPRRIRMAELTPGPGYCGTLAVVDALIRRPVVELNANTLLASGRTSATH
jgi:4'-phosphopantetheinyl transferase